MTINKITNETNINNITSSSMFSTDMVTDDDYVIIIKELYDRVTELKTAVETLTTKLNETIDEVNK
jgi:mannitol-specific phosphotransferase system IIBC component